MNNIDCYRDRDAKLSAPYRAKINGELLRTKSGSVRKFKTLQQAIDFANKVTNRYN